MVLEGDPLLYPTLLQLQWRYPDYANHHLIGQAPQCRYNDPGMEEGEGVDMYNPNLVMMNNPSPSVANTAIMNKLSSSLANAPLYIPPNSQAPKCRENPPPYDIELLGEPWTNYNPPPPPCKIGGTPGKFWTIYSQHYY